MKYKIFTKCMFPFFILIILCFSFSCKTRELKLITVKGEIPVEEMGNCLIHEHILVDFIGADSTGYHRWEKSKVIERALPVLLEAKKKGVKTFFECTPAYLGRDPLLYKELSEKTGINIVTNTGYYGARENTFVPKHAFDDTPEAFVWTHANRGTIEGIVKAAQMGAWISLDNVNKNNTDTVGGILWYVKLLTELKIENVLHKILLSHDSGWYNPGQENGGNFRGFTDIFDYLIPALKENGFSQDDIDLMLVKNPQKAYAVRLRVEKM